MYLLCLILKNVHGIMKIKTKIFLTDTHLTFLFYDYRNTPYTVPATNLNVFFIFKVGKMNKMCLWVLNTSWLFFEKFFWTVFELLVPVLNLKRTLFWFLCKLNRKIKEKKVSTLFLNILPLTKYGDYIFLFKKWLGALLKKHLNLQFSVAV